MSLIQAIIMGIIQGIAEFLPISSSGHLALMKHVLKIELDTGMLFDVLLHLGTLIAIFIVYWKDIQELFMEGLKLVGDFILNVGILIKNIFAKEKSDYKNIIDTPYRRFVILVIISTIPTGVLGYVFKDKVELAAETLIIPGIALILTAILLYTSDKIKEGKKSEKSTTYKDSIILGITQGIAVIPGLSRSGTTITTGLFLGLDKEFAVKYSFIMSIPAVLGAGLLEVKDLIKISNSAAPISNTQLLYYFIGTAISAIVGYISIKAMLYLVKDKKFKYFSYYCFIVGVIAVIAHFIV